MSLFISFVGSPFGEEATNLTVGVSLWCSSLCEQVCGCEACPCCADISVEEEWPCASRRVHTRTSTFACWGAASLTSGPPFQLRACTHARGHGQFNLNWPNFPFAKITWPSWLGLKIVIKAPFGVLASRTAWNIAIIAPFIYRGAGIALFLLHNFSLSASACVP